MKPFELVYLSLEPFLGPLSRKVRKQLLEITKEFPSRPHILDVGGRKSHYTIGVPAGITVTDLPRETEIQHSLNLGINEEVIERVRARRSNIYNVLYDDMTRSGLPDRHFDCVVAVEVLEHVEQDALFVEQVGRVLKPGGVFLMTTPNGDSVKNTNPDHKRHYTRMQLHSLLSSQFEYVEVVYAVKGGYFRKLGLRSWSPKHPVRTILSMTGNFINMIESSPESVKEDMRSTRHLFAMARKRS
jgi:SAM-dependent methyltransferase